MDKIFETALVFMWNSTLQENFNLYFSAVFLLVLTTVILSFEYFEFSKYYDHDCRKNVAINLIQNGDLIKKHYKI